MKKIACFLACLSAGFAGATAIQFEPANTVTAAGFSTTFASLPMTSSLSGLQSVDGFTFDQKDSSSNGIWTGYNPGGTGNGHGWYPNGGDFGYTEISLTGGQDFGDVSLFVGSGNSLLTYLAYELLDDGVSVLSGVLPGHQKSFHWLSISGGGFDTIRLRDGQDAGIKVGDGSFNGLAFDSVYATTTATVPEPASITVLALGLAGIRLARKRKAIRCR